MRWLEGSSRAHDIFHRMTYLRYLLLAALLGAVVWVPRWGSARSCYPAMSVRWGFLGLSDFEEGVAAPRNVAIVRNPELRDISTWPPTIVPVVEHSVEGLWRPATPPPPGTPLESPISQTVITTDLIDTEAPTGIELLSVSSGGATGGCSGTLKFDAAASPTDDQTPSDRLAYAVYAGSTQAEAMESPARVALLRYSYSPIANPGLPWVAISVLDQAGNESPRSEAVEVIDAESGCSATGVARSSSATTFLALGLLLFMATRLRLKA